MTIFIITLCFAIFGRSLGASHPWGTDLNRLISWAPPITIICYALTVKYNLPYWLCFISGLLSWVGAKMGYADANNSSAFGCLEIGALSMFKMFMIMSPFLYYGHGFIAVPLAFLTGLGVYIGYRIPVDWTIKGQYICKVGDSSWGELISKALGFGLAFGILLS